MLVDWLLDQATESDVTALLSLLGWTSLFLRALFAAEGIGLYLRKHWAEYWSSS